jgi:hypothetical protein
LPDRVRMSVVEQPVVRLVVQQPATERPAAAQSP